MHLNISHICVLQLLKAKAIAEGKVIGPRSKQQLQDSQKAVEYEPYDFPDGKREESMLRIC